MAGRGKPKPPPQAMSWTLTCYSGTVTGRSVMPDLCDVVHGAAGVLTTTGAAVTFTGEAASGAGLVCVGGASRTVGMPAAFEDVGSGKGERLACVGGRATSTGGRLDHVDAATAAAGIVRSVGEAVTLRYRVVGSAGLSCAPGTARSTGAALFFSERYAARGAAMTALSAFGLPMAVAALLPPPEAIALAERLFLWMEVS